MSRPIRIMVRILAVLTALVLLATIAAVLVLRSDRFREYVQRHIVEEVERSTGGRVELGRASFDFTHVTLDGFVLHGKEPAGEPPLVRVASATLGLKILSVMERKVDLQSLRVEQPQVRIVVYPDGSTNFPGPKTSGGGLWSEDVVNLAIRRYEINDGTVEYDGRRNPLNLRGEHLRLQMDYEGQTPSYRGTLSMDGLRATIPAIAPIEGGMNATFALEKSRVVFSQLHVATKESSADLTGVLEDMREPHGVFAIKATMAVREAVRMFKLPIDPVGSATVDGQFSVAFAQPFDWGLRGRLIASGLRYSYDRLKIEGAEVRGNVQLAQNGIFLRQMTVQALGAQVSGQAELADWRRVHVDGTIAGMDMRRAVAILTDRPVAWNGTLAGALTVDATLGQNTSVAHASLGITPTGEGVPLQGQIDATYDQAGGTIALGSSSVSTPSSKLELSGTIGQVLQVHLQSTNLDDLLPAVAIVEDNPPSEIPLKLKNGSVTADGSVTGPLDNLTFAGQVAVMNGEIKGHSFDRFSSEIEVNRSQIQANGLVLARGVTEVAGSATLTARDEKFDDAAVTAQLSIRNASLEELIREAGSSVEIVGTGSATATITGTIQRPEAQIALDVQRPAAFGEQIDRLRANVHYTSTTVEVTNGIANDGPSELQFSGDYKHRENDLKYGDLTVDVTAQNLETSRVEHVAKIGPSVDGVVAGRLRGSGRIANGAFELTAATANISAQRFTVDGEAIGDLTLTADTTGSQMTVRAGGKVRESTIGANGTWSLEGDAPGTATMTFSRLSIDSLQGLIKRRQSGAGSTSDPPPFEGFIQGGATIKVALQKLDAFTANVTLDTVQVNPRPDQQLGLGVQPQDVVLKNSQPVVVEISKTQARVVSAQFTGRDTNFTVTGTVPFDAAARADLALRGNIDLAILRLWNTDLLAKGNAAVAATVRGNIQDPNVSGRLELNNASLYLKDVPNGVDNVSGAILFDRNRATVEKLTAETGGGKIDFTGNLDFGSTLTYRLQAEARQVRVRWPEDLSTTFDASLKLTGTSKASTLSGALTLNRAVFTPRTDLFLLLAQASKPVAAPETPNEYLRGMQLDVRIISGYNFQLETSLTRDVEADIALRLRGSPVRPALLGTISINQGEVEVLGVRYSVNRGEIRFLNPLTIEPTFDADLETKARGVTVNVTLTGTLQKPKTNFSSDPPLQSSEIIALLAVGRDPSTGASQTAPGLSTSSTSSFVGAGNGLLGQALTAQLSSRTQRFFGASHVKIDPTLTGVDNLPQARVTLEQQVSKDITLTYITNLNRTQEQLVRVQWDLDRNWSAIAVRDPNGSFGIDFQFRKRFK